MASTTIKSRASATPPAQEKPQPHRFRVSVPQADEAVLEWLGLQDNPSLSVRMLIRESIERLGYVDIVNKPVAQLPKRGRPSASDEGSTDADTNDSPEGAAVRFPPVPATAHHQVSAPAPVPTSEPAQPTDLDLGDEDSAPELLGIALHPSAGAVQDTAPETSHPSPSSAPSNSEQPESGQQDVNDIFGALRK